jgi:hypothetical protein
VLLTSPRYSGLEISAYPYPIQLIIVLKRVAIRHPEDMMKNRVVGSNKLMTEAILRGVGDLDYSQGSLSRIPE